MVKQIKWLKRQYYHIFEPGRMLHITLQDRIKYSFDPISWKIYTYMGNDWWLKK